MLQCIAVSIRLDLISVWFVQIAHKNFIKTKNSRFKNTVQPFNQKQFNQKHFIHNLLTLVSLHTLAERNIF